MPKINSRAKGARGERLWRDVLREAGYTSARRGQQFSGSSDSPDVKCDDLPEVHWEVKCVENLNLRTAMEQATRDAGEGQIPIVAHKKNNQPWLITLPANEFIERFLTLRFPPPSTGDTGGASA